jgi:HD-like signal output (HDOD) protein
MSNSLIIPACPEILLELTAVMREPDPDIQRVANLVNADVGLYSTLLATVNSPALGLKQTVESVSQAITLLGFKRTLTLLHSAIIRNSLEQHGRLDGFWESASEIAGISARLAPKLNNINQDMAYSIGMLHDIGIPVMIANYSKYKDFLHDTRHNSLQELAANEVAHFEVDHFTLGYRLTKEWYLPPTVSKTILLQPLFEKAFSHTIKVHEKFLNYLAILMLAKNISSEHQNFDHLSSSEQVSEDLMPILNFLGMPKMEYLDIKETIIEDIEDQSTS